MSRLIITTHVFENHGCVERPIWEMNRWKQYAVPNFGTYIPEEAVQALRSQVESDGDYLREVLAGWVLVDDDFLTESEKEQVADYGEVRYPIDELVYQPEAESSVIDPAIRFIENELFRVAPLPLNEENFPYGFNMQITGDGRATKWLKVTPVQLRKIEDVMLGVL